MRSLYLVTTLALSLLAIGADAASLTVSSDQSVYNVGDLVTLTATGASNGTTEVDTAVFAQLNFSSVGLDFISSSQTVGNSFAGGLVWTGGALAQGPGFAVAINQICCLSPNAAFQDASGTVVLQVTQVGAYAAAFELSTADYFGATPGGPALFTVVPEPTTAGLLALGLLGLAARRR